MLTIFFVVVVDLGNIVAFFINIAQITYLHNLWDYFSDMFQGTFGIGKLGKFLANQV